MIADHTVWEAERLAVVCLLREGEALGGVVHGCREHQLQAGALVEDDHR